MASYPSCTGATSGSSEAFISDRNYTYDHSSGLAQKKGVQELAESKGRSTSNQIPPSQRFVELKPSTYSIDRFKSDPASSQTQSCFGSPGQSLFASVIRASAVIARLDESFSRTDRTSVEGTRRDLLLPET